MRASQSENEIAREAIWKDFPFPDDLRGVKMKKSETHPLVGETIP